MYPPDIDCHYIASFGSTVRQLREQQGWSQEALAERADLNRSYVGELERGKAIPSLLTLKKLSQALNLSLPSLMAHAEHRLHKRLVQRIELAAIAC